MKIIEITNGVQIQITNEECDVLNQFDTNSSVNRKSFNDRETHIANQLVNKNVLLRNNQDGQIIYKKR